MGRYRWHENWVTVPPPGGPGGARTHGLAVTRAGDLLVFHQGNPALLTYSPDGLLLNAWGDYPGAHGITRIDENGEEFLWLVDDTRGQVHKVTLSGRVLQQLESPPTGASTKARFSPTQMAVNSANGDLWLADGYGTFQVHRYTSEGKHLCSLTGEESGPHFHVPHGLSFVAHDELWVADRRNRLVRVFDGDGNARSSFGREFLSSPNGFSCGPDWILISELRHSLLAVDRQGRLLARIGENSASPNEDPGWPDRPANGIVPGKFNSPHSAVVDAFGNIFVGEWLTGGRVTKLERI